MSVKGKLCAVTSLEYEKFGTVDETIEAKTVLSMTSQVGEVPIRQVATWLVGCHNGSNYSNDL
jgi:hypothetical protein